MGRKESGYVAGGRTFFVLSFLLLCNCTLSSAPETPALKSKHAKHVSSPSKTESALPPKIEDTIAYQSDAYILHLSLAQLTLEKPAPDIAEAGADIDIANAYLSQKQNGPVLQPAVIFEYSLQGHKTHKFFAIPLIMPHEGSGFPGLNDALARMSELPYTLYDLRIVVGTLPAPQLTRIDENNAASALKTIKERLQSFIKDATPMPSMVQARLDLQLTEFFMKNGFKEAAYLAIENAKQGLAMVDESATGPQETTRNLSDQIDEKESLLHKTMPFTFDF